MSPSAIEAFQKEHERLCPYVELEACNELVLEPLRFALDDRLRAFAAGAFDDATAELDRFERMQLRSRIATALGSADLNEALERLGQERAARKARERGR